MDEDFPFSFADLSDQEEGAEGLFCAPKNKKAPSKAQQVDQDPYYPQIDKDGWFHNTGCSVEESMLQDKSGATKVKMRADHYYMLHQYQQAYDIAIAYRKVIEENIINSAQGDGGMQRRENRADATGGAGAVAPSVLKVTDSKEMLEMALRCALKLEKFTEAAVLADELTTQDVGAVLVKAKAYNAVGRYNDAALRLVQYQKTRSSNYLIWKTLGECLYQSHCNTSLNSGIERKSSLPLALISYVRARHLMHASTWPEIDFARRRYDREMKELNNIISDLEVECGLILENNNTIDQSGRYEHQQDVDVMSLREREYEDKIVTPAKNILGTTDSFPFESEVVEFIVNTWNPQLISTSTEIDQEDEGDIDQDSARNK
ncbi:hypothetical protein BGZ76_000583 [Entomortierella beljakovae]|nr:hypothetical protein BGZ76_000583 [Entomortierella beljakovae]